MSQLSVLLPMKGHLQFLESSSNPRRTVFIALLAWMLANPLGTQVLGLRTLWLRPWTMFHNVGIGLYDVRFFNNVDELQPIPWSFPEHQPQVSRQPRIRTLYLPEPVERMMHQLCDDADKSVGLRALIRRATQHGWQVKVSLDSAVCAEPVDVE